ncbi:MAG: hypothetical protein R3C49_27985 [Planctomycetaceae bacterium]
MPRMTLVLTILLVVTGSRPCVGEDNPFARWEKVRKTTEPVGAAADKPSSPMTTAPKKQGGALEYFSPNTTPPEAPSKPAEAAESKQAQTSAPVAAPSSVHKERLGRASQSPAAESARKVSTAGFQQKQGESTHGQIQKTSNEFFQDSAAADSENPFGDFLKSEAAKSEKVGLSLSLQDMGFSEHGAGQHNNSSPRDVAESMVTVESQAGGAGTASGAAELPGLSGPQSPTVTVQWKYHGEFNLGQQCRCDLVLENTGRTPVRNVVTVAILPTGLQVVKATPAPTVVDGSASWTYGELRPGEKRVVELIIIPEVEGDLQMQAFVQLTGGTSSSVSVRQPQLAVKLDGPRTVEVGQQVNYTVNVTNPGSGVARNVVIQAAIPEGLEHRQGRMLSIEIGTLNPNEVRQARLSVTAVKGGDEQMAVRVVAEGGLQDQVRELVSVAEPRLNIGLRGPSKCRTGQPADFELIVVNEGRVDSSNVRARYKVPDGYEFVKADVGGKYDPAERMIDWFVGNLAPAQVRQFHVSLRPTAPGEAVHQVGVISEHGRTTVAEHSMTVQGKADLSLKLVADRRRISVGDVVVYEFVVTNKGQSEAQNVGVSCEMPTGMELVDVSGPSEYIADNGVVIFRSLSEVTPGKTSTFAVKARCRRSGNHSLRVRVASESIEEALIAEETISAE